MKPIILIAIIGIAGAGIGMGSLTNNINLSVQDLGVGETDLVSPIDNADIKFGIEKITGQLGYKNIIRYCIITNTDDTDPIESGSTVYCKLTDADGNVAAEGQKVLTTALDPLDSTQIIIDDPGFLKTDVRNIHDVILVVRGPTP